MWRIGSVCSRWHRITRSRIFWKRADLVSLNLPEDKSESCLMNLPSNIRELRIGKNSGSDYLLCNVPRLYHILFERFPELDVLIIENTIFKNPYIEVITNDGFVYNGLLPMEKQVRKRFSLLPTDMDADFNVLVNLLRRIIVLSLRGSIITVEFRNEYVRPTSSNIRVLDLTRCLSVLDKTISQFIQLPFLEELYLAGTAIQVNGVEIILNEVPNLKVLDLDDTVVGSETFTVLRQHGKNLAEIYLGKTAVKDSDMIYVDDDSFTVLKKICLQRTAVTEVGVNKLLISVPSLTHVYLINTQVKIGWMVEQPASKRAKLKFSDCDESKVCEHFLDNKFGGKLGCQCTF